MKTTIKFFVLASLFVLLGGAKAFAGTPIPPTNLEQIITQEQGQSPTIWTKHDVSVRATKLLAFFIPHGVRFYAMNCNNNGIVQQQATSENTDSTASVTFSSEGRWSWSALSFDSHGGIYDYSAEVYYNSSDPNEVDFAIDKTKPSKPTISCTAYPDENKWYSNPNPVINVASTDNVSGVYKYKVKIEDNTGNSNSFEIDPSSPSFNPTFSTSAAHKVTVQARDYANNYSDASTRWFNFDNQAPSVPTLGPVTRGAGWIRLSFGSTDNMGIPHFSIQRKVAGKGNPWINIANNVTSYDQAWYYYKDTTVSSNTAYEYKITAYDNAGNNQSAVFQINSLVSALSTKLSASLNPAIIRIGSSSAISGLLRSSSGKALRNARIYIRRRDLNSSGVWVWRTIKALTTNIYGKFSYKVSPRKTTYYKALYPGSSNYKTSSSVALKLIVKR